MERIQFSYEFHDNDQNGDDIKEVFRTIKKDGLNCADVCEAFVDFMTSVGYNEENIVDYFNQ